MKQEYNKYLKYSSLGFQMIASIGGMAWLGHYLDGRWTLETPWMTILFSLLGVTASIYLLIKQISNES